ncbi:hypothetical protein D3C76_632210 [compost metagenome]
MAFDGGQFVGVAGHIRAVADHQRLVQMADAIEAIRFDQAQDHVQLECPLALLVETAGSQHQLTTQQPVTPHYHRQRQHVVEVHVGTEDRARALCGAVILVAVEHSAGVGARELEVDHQAAAGQDFVTSSKQQQPVAVVLVGDLVKYRCARRGVQPVHVVRQIGLRRLLADDVGTKPERAVRPPQLQAFKGEGQGLRIAFVVVDHDAQAGLVAQCHAPLIGQGLLHRGQHAVQQPVAHTGMSIGIDMVGGAALSAFDEIRQLRPEFIFHVQDALTGQPYRLPRPFEAARLFEHGGTGIADVLGKRQGLHVPATQVDHRAAAQHRHGAGCRNLVGVQRFCGLEQFGQLRQRAWIAQAQHLDIGRQQVVVHLVGVEAMQVKVIAASNHWLRAWGKQPGIDHRQREHIFLALAFAEVVGVVEEQVTFLRRQLQAADEAVAVEHVTDHDRAVQRVAAEHFRVHRDRRCSRGLVQLDDGVRQHRGAQVRVGYLAADDIGFLAADVEGMAEVVHDAYT